MTAQISLGFHFAIHPTVRRRMRAFIWRNLGLEATTIRNNSHHFSTTPYNASWANRKIEYLSRLLCFQGEIALLFLKSDELCFERQNLP